MGVHELCPAAPQTRGEVQTTTSPANRAAPAGYTVACTCLTLIQR